MNLPFFSENYRFNRKTLLLTLLVTSTGFDLLAVNLSAGNIRLSYLAYFALFLIFRKRLQFRTTQTVALTLFIALSLLGLFSTDSVLRSVLYLIWVAFSYVIIFGIFAFVARDYPAELEQSIFYAFRLQILVGLLLYLLHQQQEAGDGVSRIHLLYYEPSYFAFALIAYIAVVFFRGLKQGARSIAFDLGLLVIALYITKSATLMIAFVVVYALGNLMTDFQWKKVAWGLGTVALLLVASYAYATYGTDAVARTLNAVYNSGDLIFTLIDRGGNRIPRLEAAYSIFQDHPWLGVGIGNYENYTTHVDLSAYSRGTGDFAVENKPAVNIYIELLATTGIPAATAFFVFLARTLTLQKLRYLTDQQKSYLLGLSVLLIMLNFDANYLRPYLWMLLGIYSGCIPLHRAASSVQTREPEDTSWVKASP